MNRQTKEMTEARFFFALPQPKKIKGLSIKNLLEKMDQQEIYIPVQGFPDYVISNLGNVKSLKTCKILKQSLTHGYCQVRLCNQEGISFKKVHRLIALHFIPNPEALPEVDHINRVRSDNRIDNLRWVSSQQNSFNKNKTKRVTSSSYKGVSWHVKNEAWAVNIMKNGVSIHLGSFDDEEEAASAYNRKATELFGEHASLNVIPA